MLCKRTSLQSLSEVFGREPSARDLRVARASWITSEAVAADKKKASVGLRVLYLKRSVRICKTVVSK